jgi:hypothetical protein
MMSVCRMVVDTLEIVCMMDKIRNRHMNFSFCVLGKDVRIILNGESNNSKFYMVQWYLEAIGQLINNRPIGGRTVNEANCEIIDGSSY